MEFRVSAQSQAENEILRMPSANQQRRFAGLDWKSLCNRGVNCLKQDLQDLSDLQEWTSLLPETPVIELPNYLLKLHKNVLSKPTTAACRTESKTLVKPTPSVNA